MKYLEDEKLSNLTAALSGAAVGHSRVVYGRIEAYTMKRAGTDKKYAQILGERYVQTLQGMEEQLSWQQDFRRIQRKRSQSAGLFEEAASKRPKAGRSRASSFDATVSCSTKQEAPSSPPPPPQVVSLASALGDFTEQGTRRLMTDLILTLNASFPDYDFGSIQPEDFEKSSVADTVQRINERLSELSQVISQLWTSVDSVIHLNDCDVYSYVPQPSHQDESFLLQLKQQDDNNIEDDTVVLRSFNYFFVNKHLKRVVLFTCIETMRQEETVEETEQEEYNVYTSADSSADHMDFDLDPSAATAGGIPISTI